METDFRCHNGGTDMEELETKYRDIADGNMPRLAEHIAANGERWKPSTAI